VSRYDVGKPGDEQFEPDSDGQVLRNKLGIIDPDEISHRESALLAVAQARSLGQIESDTKFTVTLIRKLHRSWLGLLYEFAGNIRTINLAKDSVAFAPIAFMEGTLLELDKVLAEETPCDGMPRDRLVSAIARVHAELILAHPFREGNGRTARWIADLMALQAGYPSLEWEFDVNTNQRREAYFAALRQGFLMKFEPLEKLVDEAIEKALRLAEGPSDEQ